MPSLVGCPSERTARPVIVATTRGCSPVSHATIDVPAIHTMGSPFSEPNTTSDEGIRSLATSVVSMPAPFVRTT